MSSYQTYTDAQLLELLRCSDVTAFEEIYRRYWHPLFLHAYHITKDESQAKDIVQELFIDAWSKPFAKDIHTSLKAYLYVSVRNRVLNSIRKNKIRQDFIGMLAVQLPVEEQPSVVEDMEYRALIAMIDKEVEQLPPRMREVFTLSRKELLTHREIAARLGTSEETVKKQISRSLKILRIKVDKNLLLAALVLEICRHHT